MNTLEVINNDLYVDFIGGSDNGGGSAKASIKLHCMVQGCAIDENAIASNFTSIAEGFDVGGIAIAGDNVNSTTGGISYVLYKKFPGGDNFSYLVRFKTPQALKESSDFIIQGTRDSRLNNTDSGVCRIALSNNLSKVTFNLNSIVPLEFTYAFDVDTQYDIKISTTVSPTGTTFYVKKADEAQYVELGSSPYAWTAEYSDAKTNFLRTQWGYCGRKGVGMEAYEGSIDLKHTGFINDTTNFELWFAE